jgi:predicted enzyme related to lactoylglutathione lyase
MSERATYRPGVPCWVDTLDPDPQAAMRFYGALLGWEFDGPGPGDYYVARLRGRDVAGVGAQPPGVPAAWSTYVAVASAEEGARAGAGAGGRVVMQPFDALPAGRVAVLEDPTAAVIGLWEARERTGCQLVNEPGAYVMSVLHTGQPQDAARFYRDTFGWETEPFTPGAALFRLPGYVGGEPAQPVPRDVVAVMAEGEGRARWSVGFWVPDADALAARTPELGGSVLAPPFDAGGMRQAVLADPAGAAFSVTTVPRG